MKEFILGKDLLNAESVGRDSKTARLGMLIWLFMWTLLGFSTSHEPH
jgi:hypothetical protein